MIKTGLFNQSHLAALKKAVGVYAQRHRVTAENISNRTHPAHLPIGGGDLSETRPEVVENGSGYDNGVNDVDVDLEMTNLATNDLSYRMATRLLSMRYSVLRGAIKGQMR